MISMNFICGCGGSGTTAIALDIAAAKKAIVLPVEFHDLYFAWREKYVYKTKDDSKAKKYLQVYEEKIIGCIRMYRDITKEASENISVVDHTPVNLHATNLIRKKYYNHQIFFVIRNPFDTVKGLTKRWANPYNGRARNIQECISEATTRWVNCAEEIKSELKNYPKYQLIKYEDFVPENQINKTNNDIEAYTNRRKQLFEFLKYFQEKYNSVPVSKNILEKRANLDLIRTNQLEDGFVARKNEVILTHKIDKDIIKHFEKKDVASIAKHFGYRI